MPRTAATTRRRLLLLAGALATTLALSGCPNEIGSSADTGAPSPKDAGAGEPDAQAAGPDAAAPDTGLPTEPDAALAGADAAASASDAAESGPDAAEPGPDAGPLLFSVSGMVSGMVGAGVQVKLDNHGEVLVVSANGPFIFPTKLLTGATYEVTVLAPPDKQTCGVVNGSGMINGADVTNVQVTCQIADAVTVSGTVHGLAGALTLTEATTGATRDLAPNTGSVFSFNVFPNDAYALSITAAPADQTCALVNAAGPTGTTAVTGVDVYCVSVPKALTSPIGDKWNDYVRGNDPTQACNGTEQGYWGVACIHAAEHLYVDYPVSSCAGLAATDALGAFEWSCAAVSDGKGGTVARFTSRRASPLSSLLDFAGATFRNNAVSLTGGPVALTTPGRKWWANPVVKLTGTNLTAEGTVYLVTQKPGSVSFSAGHVAYVQDPTLVAGGSSPYYVDGNWQNFTWIEGRFDASSATSLEAVRFSGGAFNVVDHVEVSGLWTGTQIALSFAGDFKGGNLTHLSVSAPATVAGRAIDLNAPTGGWTTLRDVSTANLAVGVAVRSPRTRVQLLSSTLDAPAGAGESTALQLMPGSYDCLVSGVTSVGVGAVLQTAAAAGNVLSGVSASGLRDPWSGVEMRVPQASASKATNTLMGVTVAHAGTSWGPAVRWSHDRVDTMVAVLLAKNRSGLLTEPWSGGPTMGPNLYGFAAAWNVTSGIALNAGGLPITTAGKVLVNRNVGGADGGAGQCTIPATTDCQAINLTAGNDVGGGDYFADPPYPDLRTLDGAAPNVMLGANAIPTASDNFVHIWHSPVAPASQAACDAAFPGSSFVTDHCEARALLYALEVMDDGVGNDNLLCESGETCVHLPNLGAYQGDGDLVSAGSVSGAPFAQPVTLLVSATNGVD